MKNEAYTDLWVFQLLKEAGLSLYPQGSDIKEIQDALRTASKRGTGSVGFPEYTGVVKDYLLVIENKADLSLHERRNGEGLISDDTDSICQFANLP